MTELLECKPVSESVKKRSKESVRMLKEKGINPKLAILRVGEKGPDLAYERGATKALEAVGIEVEVYALPSDTDEETYIKKMEELNTNSSIHGILPFRPLDTINEKRAITDTIDPAKDVDGSTETNLGKILLGDESALAPCTAQAVMEILDFYNIDVLGKNITIINRSNVIGKPLSMMLIARHATVSVCNSKTEPLDRYTKQADIVITAIPATDVITEDMVTKDTILIDASVIRVEKTDENGIPVINAKTGKPAKKTVGCCSEKVYNKVKMITPVPGVGGITSALLAGNVVKACYNQQK